MKPVRLRCESLAEPLGIDEIPPRFSWIVDSEVRGASRSAYRIPVAGSRDVLGQKRGDLWDSGKVASNQTVNVVYQVTNSSVRS